MTATEFTTEKGAAEGASVEICQAVQHSALSLSTSKAQGSISK